MTPTMFHRCPWVAIPDSTTTKKQKRTVYFSHVMRSTFFPSLYKKMFIMVDIATNGYKWWQVLDFSRWFMYNNVTLQGGVSGQIC